MMSTWGCWRRCRHESVLCSYRELAVFSPSVWTRFVKARLDSEADCRHVRTSVASTCEDLLRCVTWRAELIGSFTRRPVWPLFSPIQQTSWTSSQTKCAMRSDQADQLPLSDRLTIVQRHVPPTPPTPPPGEDVEHPVGQQARVHNDATMVMMMMMMMTQF